MADGNEIFPGVRVQLTGGHTIGHAAYVVEAGGRRLIAFGDALHSPIQIAHPEWWAAPDHDRTLSTGTPPPPDQGTVASRTPSASASISPTSPSATSKPANGQPTWHPIDA